MFKPENERLRRMHASAEFLGEPADGVVRELIDALLLERELAARATRYEFGSFSVDSRSKDEDLWAIVVGRECWTRESRWEIEPSPSNRDDAFLARSRWTLSEALSEITRQHFIGGESTFKAALAEYGKRYP